MGAKPAMKFLNRLIASIVGLIILFAIIPKAVWVTIFIICGVFFIVYLVSKILPMTKEIETTRANDEPEPLFHKTSSSGKISRSSYRIPSPPAKVALKARWIQPGESVSIAGYTIAGGMLYVGSGLPERYGQQDSAVIDPNKQVSTPENLSERLVGYWPSYSEISPKARGAYLSWLSSGRNDPEADVSYVFLFFYGLERRILVDAVSDRTVEGERPIIRKEVERLLNIYGKKSGSVQNYLSSFIQMLDFRDFGKQLYTKPVPPLDATCGLPFYLRLALGQAAVDAVPVPPHLAVAWVMYDPLISKRTPVTRCPEEFSKLFYLKYKQSYSEGIKLSVNKTKLSFNYQPASKSLQVRTQAFENIPDIAAVMDPQQKLMKIVNECADELDSYSRFLGRNAEKRNYIDALLLLPVALWPDTTRTALSALKEQVSREQLILKVNELISKFGNSIDLSKEKLIALAKALESEQIGIEPDIISYPYALKSDDNILIYFLNERIPDIRTTSEYQTAALTLQLASAVANSDGEVTEDEIKFINKQLEKWQHLSDYHLKRLQAHLNLMIQKPITIRSLKKKLENVSIDDRKTILAFISLIALADGIASSDEISFLEKVYKTLEVDVSGLYSLLHNGGRPAEIDDKVVASGKFTAITLDKNKIENLRKDTEKVSALLSGIFTEKPSELVEPVETEDSVKENTLGLDDAHAAFMRMLMSKQVWERQELINIAADLDLMVDGAIETVNEASFEKYEQAVIEGDDPVEINMEIREKVLA